MTSWHKIVPCENHIGRTPPWADCCVIRSDAGVNSGVFFFVDPSSSETIVVKPMHGLEIERTRIADTLFQAANLQIAPITTILDSENDAIVRGKLPEPEKAHIQKLRSNRDNLGRLLKNH